MNERELGEIRRRVRRDRSNMTAIYGCYVNSQKEIISTFCQSTGIMPENEAEKYFAVMKRALSGTIGKNLIDICFSTKQVADGAEHKLLMEVRKSALREESSRMELFRKIIDTVSFEENYVILIGCDSYDVPFRGKDGEMQSEGSTEVYTYLLCAVCPVKQKKPSLRYVAEEKEFHDGGLAYEVSAPEMGFLFPAFDDRRTNIYNALFYTRDTKCSHDALVTALFNTKAPKPAAEQKKSFEALLTTSLGEDCSMEVVQTVHNQICQSIEMHKESKIPDTLLISKEQVKTALSSCGVPENRMAKFSIAYDEAFGHEAELYPKNVINKNSFEIKTPSVSIKVDPEFSDLIETRVIGGVKYILIPADEDVEVNGVSIHIHEQKVEV